uniref:NADH-ubiquinone oxidoreductase chain 3 n=1 Tax=Zeugophora sp. BMNH 840207 TaxID=904173 RepID=E3VT23_9CUCU|nr:NADH dehydrogenase subunit 3 [Zeugophora sp. BMNH 840207]
MIISLFFISNIIMMIIFLMMILVNLISKKSYSDREKGSPFECGFDPKTYSRLPFSLQFFLIAVIFLIFDVEITLILPMILSMKFSNLLNYGMVSMFFFTILLFGTIHEWNQGALEWAI